MEPSTTSAEKWDYARWNAHRWSEVEPNVTPDAALAAVRYMGVADMLAESQLQSLKPWRELGVVSVDDFRTLALIRLGGPQGSSVSSIAAALRVTPGTISNRIERLVKNGWIVRVLNETDRRSSVLELSESRTSEVDKMYHALVEQHRRFFRPITASESETLTTILAKLLPEIDNPYTVE